MKRNSISHFRSARVHVAQVLFVGALLFAAVMITLGIAPQDATQAAPSLARFMPHGAILYLEAKDFGELLREWNASHVKTEWLASENYRAFANSRLFLRLEQARTEFASAAGIPADSQFLGQAAREQSAIGIYDIGELHFLFISKIDSAAAMQSALWQSRGKLEPRTAGSASFFVKKDDASGRIVAFALKDSYLLLATQEELLAGALEAMNGGAEPKLADETWFSAATSAAREQGDLRLVLNLTELVKSPHFRSYWIQRNVSELQKYSAAISDLYREQGRFREERVLLRDSAPATDATADSQPNGQEAAEGERVASALAAAAPRDIGIYRTIANPSADEVVALVSEKLLAPWQAALPPSAEAPDVTVTNGTTGTPNDLETRIDEVVRPQTTHAEEPTSALRKLIENSEVDAMLEAQSTERDVASDFVQMDSAVILAAKSDWEISAAQDALASAIGSVSTSDLGLRWKSEKESFGDVFRLDGQFPLFFAVRGKYLLIANSPDLLGNIPLAVTSSAKAEDVSFSARINFERERPSFMALVRAIDGANFSDGRREQGDDISSLGDLAQGPTGFLSGNAGSLIRALRRIGSESVTRRDFPSKVLETVTYDFVK